MFPKLLCCHALKIRNAILSVINPNEKKESIIIANFYNTYCSLMRTFRTALDQNEDTRSNKYNNR